MKQFAYVYTYVNFGKVMPYGSTYQSTPQLQHMYNKKTASVMNHDTPQHSETTNSVIYTVSFMSRNCVAVGIHDITVC